MSPHKLMDLVLTLGVQILELVEVSLHVETVRGQDVRLPLHQVLTLHPSDLAANVKIRIDEAHGEIVQVSVSRT